MPMPIGVYAGLEITGATVRDAVTNASAQADAVLALHERFNTPVMLTAMDLLRKRKPTAVKCACMTKKSQRLLVVWSDQIRDRPTASALPG
jgi:hypothetical protein